MKKFTLKEFRKWVAETSSYDEGVLPDVELEDIADVAQQVIDNKEISEAGKLYNQSLLDAREKFLKVLKKHKIKTEE